MRVGDEVEPCCGGYRLLQGPTKHACKGVELDGLHCQLAAGTVWWGRRDEVLDAA